MTALARYLDLPSPSFDSLIDWVLALRARIGIPDSLAEIGVETSHVERLAAMAENAPSSATNPVPLTTNNLNELFIRCIDGRLR